MNENYMVGIKQRNIALCVIFSIITCGIYSIYWFICLVNELNMAAGTESDTSGGLVFLFSLITCNIYGLYWFFKAGEKVEEVQMRSNGRTSSNNGILYLILSFLGLSIINYCLIQSELNKVASY